MFLFYLGLQLSAHAVLLRFSFLRGEAELTKLLPVLLLLLPARLLSGLECRDFILQDKREKSTTQQAVE